MTEDCKLPRDGKGCLRDTCHAECIRLENKQKRLADLDELYQEIHDAIMHDFKHSQAKRWHYARLALKRIAQKRKEIEKG